MEDLGRIKLVEYQIRLFQDGNQFFENTFKNNVLIIGRDEDCDLIIQDRSISRKHLRIDVDIDKFYVTDMGSSNGTYVNNEKIESRVEINTETHIRAGKITIQVVTPEVKKVELDNLHKAGKKYQKSNEESPEITLSKIALRVEDALSRAEHEEDVVAMIDRDFVNELIKKHQQTDKHISKKIEALVLWKKSIYQMQEFGYQDTIVVGPTFNDSIHIPSMPYRWVLSKYEMNEAIFTVPKTVNVFAIRGDQFLTKQQLVNEKRIREDQNTLQIQISHYDVLRVEIDENTQLYFRYVPSTVALESKKFLNPDELMKKAIIASFVINLTLAAIFFMIPKDKLAKQEKPKPPPIPVTVIVEQPPAPPPPPPEPPPPPPEPPPPEPPPPVEKPPEPPPEPPKPKPEPPKPKPPKPKPEPPKPKPKVEKLPPPKPVQKTTEVAKAPVQVVKPQPAQNPQGNNKPSGPAPVVTAPTPTPPAPPPPKPVDVTKLGALAAISGMKLDARSTKAAPQNVNIAQNTATTNTGADVGVSAIAGDLKNQAAQAAQSNASKASGPIRTKGSGSVGSGYGTEGIGTGTGKRGVKGAVVGKPQLATSSGRTEGLSREQVLKALQPHLGKIQSCYERAMLSDPNLAGKIDFEWTIAPSGGVTDVTIKKNSVAGGEQLGECVVGVIRGIKFPQATNGEQTVPSIGFPFGRL